MCELARESVYVARCVRACVGACVRVCVVIHTQEREGHLITEREGFHLLPEPAAHRDE